MEIRCINCNKVFSSDDNETLQHDLIHHCYDYHRISERIGTSLAIRFFYTVQIECTFCHTGLELQHGKIDGITDFMKVHICPEVEKAKLKALEKLETQIDREDREEIKRNFCGYGTDI